MLISRINDFHHRLLTLFIREGEPVVDCTVGNGHDALFLAERIGRTGFLFGFDVQQEAIEATGARLREGGIDPERYLLIRDSHRKIGEYVPGGIGAVVYNLGYMPGGDRAVVTDGETAVASVDSALRLIRPEGVVSITLYYGHEGGREEAQGLLDYVRTLDHGNFKVLHLNYPNFPKDPPSILLIQRAE